MKKHRVVAIFCTVLLVCVNLGGCNVKKYTKDSFPGWTWVGGNSEGESLYMDKANIKKSNGNTFAWFTMTIGGGDYMTYYLEIDCSDSKYRGLSAVHYDEHGNVKESIGEQNNWNYAAIGTAYNVMIKEACK